MLRSSRCMTGIIARNRMIGNVCRIRHCNSMPAPTDLQSPLTPVGATANELLTGWPGVYRLEINNVIREISLDTEFAAVAKERYTNGLPH